MPNPPEPNNKRVMTFFDGQNLYHGAREAFGHGWPKFDPLKLSHAVCNEHDGWTLKSARFYTGIPAQSEEPFWAGWWQRKLLAISRSAVKVESRELRYRDKTIDLGDGCTLTRRVGEEKGIDVRIAVDLIRYTYDKELDVALIFSQDQDLAEAVQEAKRIAAKQGRWVRIAAAYPVGGDYRNKRGINATDWFKMPREFYENCCDERDYRP